MSGELADSSSSITASPAEAVLEQKHEEEEEAITAPSEPSSPLPPSSSSTTLERVDYRYLPQHLESIQIGHYWKKLLSAILKFQHHLSANRPLNICIFGWYGAGKSSFINTLLTAFSTSEVPITHAVTARSAGHVTTVHERIRVNGMHLYLIDTVGVDSNTWADESAIKAFLNGDDTHSEEAKRMNRDPNLASEVYDKPRLGAIHGAIWVTSYLVLHNEEAMKKQKKILKTFEEGASGQPMVVTTVVTNIDQNDVAIRDHPEQILRSPVLAEAKSRLKRIIPPSACFPCKPYTSERRRNLHIETVALLALHTAINNAVQRWKAFNEPAALNAEL